MAYALDDNGSLQKTGSASFFGSSVSPICELSSGRPTSQRLGTDHNLSIAPANLDVGPVTYALTHPLRLDR